MAALERQYSDLHDHVEALKKAGLLVVVDRKINKETYPPISLPKREYMEAARKIWEELGLPRLKPERPWFGYDLGEWTAQLEEQAQRAVRGDYWETGRWCAEHRRSDVAMNTELRTLDDAP